MTDTNKQAAPTLAGETNGARPEDLALRGETEQEAQGESVLSLDTIQAMPPEKILQMLHELEVHRVELVTQNKELRDMQLQLDAERLRYVNLYDQAPTGYCTLNEQELFLEANRTAASLLGVAPSALSKQPFTRFILKEDQDIYYLHRKKLYASNKPQECELRMQQADGTVFWAHLVSSAASQLGGRCECRVVISDISERKLAEQALAEEMTRRRIMFEQSPDGILIIDPESKRFINFNTAAHQQLGYSREEFAQLSIHDLDVMETVEETKARVAGVLRDGKADFETLQRSKQGEIRNVLVKAQMIDIQGHAGYHCVWRDITEQKQAEMALRKSEARMRAITESAKDAIIMMDQDGCISYWNPAAEQIFGYTPSEVLGQNLHRLITPQRYHPAHNVAFAKFRRSGQGEAINTTLELEACHKNGHEFPVDLSLAALKFQDGWHSVGIVREITERKRSEAALRESNERFKALHEAISGGIVLHDQGLILDCNQGLADQTGYSMEELINTDGVELIAPAWRELVRQNIRRGYLQSYEVEGLRKDGTTYPLSIRGRAIPYKGRVVRVTEFRDVSEHRQAEEERERLQVQLMQAQKMESVGRLAGGVAHDFNNMLSIILGVAEMAEEHVEESSPLYAYLQEIQMAAQRSVALTRQLLAFARKQIVAPQVLDINDTVEGLLKMLRRLINEDIQLTWVPCANLWPVQIDPTQVDQILANLCVNARDAIPGNGNITIATSNVTLDAASCADHLDALPGDYILMTVSDNGKGMDPITLKMIFEPFFTTKEMGAGTGLGLATVYGIVKQNRGFINVQSEPDHGTTFQMYLPRHGGTVTIDWGINKEVRLLHEHKTVLVVEDEEALLQLNTLILGSLGYTVIAAAAPGEALRLAQEHPGEIDLLLTDVIMPEMNGRALAIRLHQLYPQMKQIFMSGYTADIIARHGVLDTGVCFLQKPFFKRDLVAKINEVFSQEQH